MHQLEEKAVEATYVCVQLLYSSFLPEASTPVFLLRHSATGPGAQLTTLDDDELWDTCVKRIKNFNSVLTIQSAHIPRYKQRISCIIMQIQTPPRAATRGPWESHSR
jgi:hypothetical protein